MRVALVGTGKFSDHVALRLEKEGVQLGRIEAVPSTVSVALSRSSYDYLVAVDASDEMNLVVTALAKQYGPIKTVAAVKKEGYLKIKDVDLQKAFHVDYLLYPDLLVVDTISQYIFGEGIYSRSFLHGTVLVRTVKVQEEAFFCGKTLVELRDRYKELLVALIRRPHKILATSQEAHSHLVGSSDELIFAHGKDLLLPEDEITLVGKTEAVLELSKELSAKKLPTHSVQIVGVNTIGKALLERLEKYGMKVRLEPEVVPGAEQSDVFVACHEDEEHNFVIALQAKDRGVEKVIAVLSDEATCQEAERLGIVHVNASPTQASDILLERIQGGKISSIMSLYDARAEIFQAQVTVDSSIVGIPLSVLGPTLPTEMLIGVIYTRGRIFIATGSHILKPQDECLIIADPKHRPLLQKVL